MQLAGLLVRPVEHVLLPAERLDRPQSQRRFLDVGGDVAGLIYDRRDSRVKARSKRRTVAVTGSTEISTTTPSGQYIASRMPDTDDLQQVEQQEDQTERQQPGESC